MKDESGQNAMVKLLLASYDDFRTRLKRRLGSEDLAADVLHETYLRVDRLGDIGDVKRPQAYLFRIALNIAADLRESDARLLTGEEVESLLHGAEEQLGPERIVGGHNDLALLVSALHELPRRRRQILVAARLEEAPHLEISKRFGISTRTVEKELKSALGFCAERLQRKVIQRFGPGAGKPST
ncbi:RNA polymerase sigma factor [Pseudomonas wadenswilerensis]